MCGGTHRWCDPEHIVHGLSPRVRGNLRRSHLAYRLHRSIPACAGEPSEQEARGSRRTVNPRVCGGTVGTGSKGEPTHGQSPRVRGNRQPDSHVIPYLRSIPACAGEPSCGMSRPRSGTVYPRVCGGTLEIRHCRHSLSLSRSVRIAEITRDLACITSRRSRSARFRHRGEQ